MICEPASLNSLGVIALTLACVPTGMNTGVSMTPCRLARRPRLGRKGTGKSTFLKIAAGLLEPDAGLFTRRNDLVTAYMPQMFELEEQSTVHANILAGAAHVLALIAEYESLSAENARGEVLLDR